MVLAFLEFWLVPRSLLLGVVFPQLQRGELLFIWCEGFSLEWFLLLQRRLQVCRLRSCDIQAPVVHAHGAQNMQASVIAACRLQSHRLKQLCTAFVAYGIFLTRNQTHIPLLAGRILPTAPPGKSLHCFQVTPDYLSLGPVFSHTVVVAVPTVFILPALITSVYSFCFCCC